MTSKSSFERFYYWIVERHKIHVRKEEGEPKPWTNDPILRDNFFTNPYRENDKVTKWFKKHVRQPLSNDPSVIFATVCFRWFNYIPTGEVLLKSDLLTKWDLRKALPILRKQRNEHGKVFTGAFVITNGGFKEPKIDVVAKHYVTPHWRDRYKMIDKARQWTTLEGAHKDLMQYAGMRGGGFMAYEVVCDLRYTDVLRKATDVKTWCNPGPGARRGMNRVLGNLHIHKKVPNWNDETSILLSLVNRRLKNEDKRWRFVEFEMREIEHSLCEFDKYERARLGDGRLKRRYHGNA